MAEIASPIQRPAGMLFPHFTTGKPCEHCGGDGWETDQQATGADLRAVRRAKGLQAKDVAAAMGISAQYLSDLEHGRRAWTRTLSRWFYEACRKLSEAVEAPR